MANDISLKLNEKTRDRALIYSLLGVRLNYRLLRDIYSKLYEMPREDIEKLCEAYIRTELTWVYEKLGDNGLTPEGFEQFLDPLNPNL